jgi:hypothetical protein
MSGACDFDMRLFCCRGCFGGAGALAFCFEPVCCPGTNSTASACNWACDKPVCVSCPPNCLPSAVRRSGWSPRPPRPPPRPLPPRRVLFRGALSDAGVSEGVEAVWMDVGFWDDGATEAGLNSRESDTLAAPPLPPRRDPLGRRGLDLGADCDCVAAWPEGSAMMASVVEAVAPVDRAISSVSLRKDSRCANV